ncbi:MAG: hypothetical protein ACHQYQ_01085 [Bacteriovoracales bacterium]
MGFFTRFFISIITLALIGCGRSSSSSSGLNKESFNWLKENIHLHGYGELKEIYYPPSSYTTRKDELNPHQDNPCIWEICSYEINTKDNAHGKINYLKNHYFVFSAQDIDPESIVALPYQSQGYFIIEMQTQDNKDLIHWMDKNSITSDDNWAQSESSKANFVIGNNPDTAKMAAQELKKAVLECKYQPNSISVTMAPFSGPVKPCMTKQVF